MARFGSILDHLTEGFQVVDRDWRYVYVNDSAAAHGRRSKAELLGRSMLEVYPGIENTEMFALLERCMRERSRGSMENHFEYPDGRKAWFEIRAQPIPEGLVVLSLDISERKRIEAQLLHAQKTEAIGRLAGGIAHDFNNLLTVISSCARILERDLEEEAPARSEVSDIATAAERATGLVRQLLALSRQQPIAPQVLDLNHLVRGFDTMLRRFLPASVVYATALAPALWTTCIDRGAYEQVLMNLVVNACDAMPDGGQLTIATANAAVDARHELAQGDLLEPGEYVLTTVSDSGVGMDQSTRRQIFEPFFTTKAPGKGTGLGLAICSSVIQQAGGHIEVSSEPGRGTRFSIYLPRADGEPARH